MPRSESDQGHGRSEAGWIREIVKFHTKAPRIYGRKRPRQEQSEAGLSSALFSEIEEDVVPAEVSKLESTQEQNWQDQIDWGRAGPRLFADAVLVDALCGGGVHHGAVRPAFLPPAELRNVSNVGTFWLDRGLCGVKVGWIDGMGDQGCDGVEGCDKGQGLNWLWRREGKTCCTHHSEACHELAPATGVFL